MDLFYLGDALRAFGLIPTLAAVQKLGGTKTKGQASISIEEFLPIVYDVKNAKDMGNFEVFLECLRLYDDVSMINCKESGQIANNYIFWFK